MLDEKAVERMRRFGVIAEKVRAELEGNVLDYGCGDGLVTRYLNSIKPFCNVVGYEPFPKREFVGDMNMFSSEDEVLSSGKYDSVFSFFVLHEAGAGILEKMKYLCKEDGGVSVLDYNMKGVNKDYFLDVFSSDRELVELHEMGEERAWKVHTARGLEECVRDMKSLGLRDVSWETIENDYFLCSGRI
ncbi:methyltransferase domain-containing protein [Methanococcoides sp. SA1]|nr:methyltransferase domain-containing protein [Methanococcoides sp. SA1]